MPLRGRSVGRFGLGQGPGRDTVRLCPPPLSTFSVVVTGRRSRRTLLDDSIDSFWLIGFLVWFVVGPRFFLEGPGSPRNPEGWPWVASRGPRGPRSPGQKT